MALHSSQLQFSQEEIERVYSLLEKLIGTQKIAREKAPIFLVNLRRQMTAVNIQELSAYLEYTKQNPQEFEKLISALTIHTTFWFRETGHFSFLRQRILEKLSHVKNLHMEALSLGCSTGQEVYSIALVFEDIRRSHPKFEYHLHGIDIDPVSIKTAQKAIYSKDEMKNIPKEYLHSILVGSGPTDGLFTLHQEIRKRCSFRDGNALNVKANVNQNQFDLIFCRNLLIYFTNEQVEAIIDDLQSLLNPQGLLVLGHSERFERKRPDLVALGASTYCLNTDGKPPKSDRGVSYEHSHRLESSSISLKAPASYSANFPVLVVDDDPNVADITKDFLEEAGYQVVTFQSPSKAIKYCADHPVFLTLVDYRMPEYDGIEFIDRIQSTKKSQQFVIITGFANDEVKREAAKRQNIEVLNKPIEASTLLDRVRTCWYMFNHAVENKKANELSLPPVEAILIGASTGGPEALTNLLGNLSGHFPPIVFVQHLPKDFQRPLLEKLAAQANLTPALATEEGVVLHPNHIYTTPGDYHVTLHLRNGELVLKTDQSPPRASHRPSVDILFESSAMIQKRFLAILLTGMGRDGAMGLKLLKNSKAITAAQNHQSSVVFGMPREAIRLEAADYVGNIQDLRRLIEATRRGLVSKAI